MADSKKSMTDEDALVFHAQSRPGKLEISATKPLTTQRDLSLAYSPGVAIPCLRIREDPSTAYDYTAKGNMVAVISNGTAVLGLGSIGALASKPVMEGKAVLFKRFADVDGIDLEVDTTDVDEFINAVRYLGPSFGGINLEDIKAPECFIIEQRLRELMDIPVFHDDQHGTAIIATAGLLNALDLTGRDIKKTKLVCNGAGAAAIACVELMKALGMPSENVIMCDSKGVIYQGREEGMNQWKSAHAVATKDRNLQDALKEADVFFGLSVKGAVNGQMVKDMAKQPIIFAMANPDPEITPDEVKAVRKDAIMATGRSDFPNQVNNVLGFPYIFRGALDVRARTINDQMKTAAARAIAELAREDVPDEVAAAYGGTKLVYSADYIIPAPFDPRLIVAVPAAVAQAAMDSGVAAKPIIDMERYRQELKQRLDPTAGMLQLIFSKVRANPRRVTFAEGEEERVIRAAVAFGNAGYGYPVLIGREDRIVKKMQELALDGGDIEIQNAKLSHRNEKYADFLYKRLQRKGFMYRDCLHQVNQNRNVFASCMLALNETDAVVTGITRHFHDSFEAVGQVIDAREGEVPMGLMIIVSRGRTYFVADTSIHDTPDAETLADISEQTAIFAQSLGLEPRVAFMSASSFGNPSIVKSDRIRDAVEILNQRLVSFEFDGEMSPSAALNPEQRERLYPFCKLSGDANILVMPGLHSAHIATRLLQEIGKCTVIGPLVMGMSKPVQIVQTGASVNDLVNAAALAVHDALR